MILHRFFNVFTTLILIVLFLVVVPISFISATHYPEVSHIQFPLLFGLFMTLIPYFVAIRSIEQIVYKVKNKFKLFNFIASDTLIIMMYITGLSYLTSNNAGHAIFTVTAGPILIVCCAMLVFVPIYHFYSNEKEIYSCEN